LYEQFTASEQSLDAGLLASAGVVLRLIQGLNALLLAEQIVIHCRRGGLGIKERASADRRADDAAKRHDAMDHYLLGEHSALSPLNQAKDDTSEASRPA